MQRRKRIQEVAVFDSLPFFLFLSVGAVALFSFIAVASWADARRREREAFYKSETLKKLAETQGTGATSALEILREEERIAARRKIEGMKLGGLVLIATGLGLIVLLVMLVRNEPVYAVGLIPLLIGAALLVYAYWLAPKE
jgi:ferric-dicitrate binding protein FerR (iron transport regulator)